MNFPGTGPAERLSPSITLPKLISEQRRTLFIGLTLAAILAAARLSWNLLHENDLFLDSWVLVHILSVLEGTDERLPRATLTLQFPLSYLPGLPLSQLLGPLDTIKFAYPVLASLAVAPAYAILRNGPAAVAGALALVLLPDLAVKGLTGTPQGLALPLFLLALYFALRGQRLAFVGAATLVLLTHHLTGMVTLVAYYTVLAMPGCHEPGWLRREAPYLAYFSLWPLFWAWAFFQTDQTYIWPIFLSLAAFAGGSLALFLYFSVPYVHRLVERLGAWLERLPVSAYAAAAAGVAVLGWLLSTVALDSPGLSSEALANRAVVAIYAALLFTGALSVLTRRHLGLVLLFFTLGWLGFLVLPTGCHRVFDGLRLADYSVLAGLVALLSPGLRARWRQPAIVLSLVLVFAAAGLRLEVGRERLFSISDGHLAAAAWVAENTPPGISIATDTKMSLLILGEADRSGTFEGSRWLFDGSPIGETISGLNSGSQFAKNPITHVLLTDYMLSRGADVGWFGATSIVNPALFTELDGIGTRVYAAGGVTIWQLDASLAQAQPRQLSSSSALDTLTHRIFGSLPLIGDGGLCD